MPTSSPTRTASPTYPPSTHPTVHPTTSISPTTTKSPTSLCNISENNRVARATEVIKSISETSSFLNKNSSQSIALDWVIEKDTARICPDDPRLIQRYTLAVLYFSMDGDNWTSCGRLSDSCNGVHFLSAEDECKWIGLDCNGEKELTQIHLDEKGLIGMIPSELSVLSSLEILDLDENQLYGSIPSSLGLLRKLQVLDLDKNIMTGTLPESLYDMKELKVLDLNNNRFSGTISPKIGDFQQLEFVQLQNNFFLGVVPKTLKHLENIKILTLNGNLLVGEIPEEICSRINTTIRELWADCGLRQAISCSCCTRCY